ncbi:8472_t:CDS:10 [Ambispora gerdemannii]|uniref:Presequence protease, mitochondrial n=1 Tax=Ambispora gerdemannii TaxID=144530 RepID=A0A9N9FKJ2_9GLOM|nr:8472_t:CDS:10 [Ambispora gerdemannii]
MLGFLFNQASLLSIKVAAGLKNTRNSLLLRQLNNYNSQRFFSLKSNKSLVEQRERKNIHSLNSNNKRNSPSNLQRRKIFLSATVPKFASALVDTTSKNNTDIGLTSSNNSSVMSSTNFELVRSIKTDYDIDITKYISKKTGLSVLHVDFEGPLVKGYFVLATEATDDDGCPHTLEQFQRIMYPPGIGYRSETGGLMECIRKLNVDKIRQYHRDYYRPDNLCLIITGKVPHENLLQVLQPLDERIASKGALPPAKRPWVESPAIPPLEKSVEQVIEFPDEDESMGQILIGWQGPKINEFLDLMALEMLHKYLSDSAISVLQKEFVEIAEPLCTEISFHITNYIRVPIYVEFSNVPTESLEKLSSQIFPVLERVAKEGFDMKRMKNVIYRDRLKTLNYIEANPAVGFAMTCIAGKPSAEFAKKLADDEKQRIEKQREELGPERLKELELLFEEAKKKNELPLPPEIIKNFPIPHVDSIPFIKVVLGRNIPDPQFQNPVQEHLDKDSKVAIPYFIQYGYIQSAFIKVSIYISTAALPPDLRPYLEIYLDSFYSLPLIRPDGTRLTYEEVIKELNEDTVSYLCGLGAGGSFEDLLCFSIKVEANKYAKAIEFLRDLLWHTEFAVDRIKNITTKLINDIPSRKRDGYRMAATILRTIIYDPVNSNHNALNVLHQEKFLPDVIKLLDENPEKVVQDLKKFREILTRPENFRINVVGDIFKIENPKSAWAEHFKNLQFTRPIEPVHLAQEVLTESGKHPGNKGYVISLPTIESTFSVHVAKGITEFNSPDLAPLIVLCELLDAMEGILWRLIRGQGLAYGNWLQVSVETGLIYFAVFKSPDAFKAFDQARQSIDDLAQKKIEFEQIDLEGAQSSVIYSIASEEKSKEQTASKLFITTVLKNLPPNHSQEFIKKVQAVKIEDLYVMLNKYLTNLFLAETSNVVLACTPTKVKDVQEGFAKRGFKLEEKSLDSIIVNTV